MSADAIVNITQALSGRLQAALAASGVPGTVFVGPLDDPDAAGAALILFLYRITPNASLRNGEHKVLDTNMPPRIVVHRNSLPLDLYFLITVGTRAGQSEEPMLRALGYAIRELQNDAGLAGPAIGQETVHLSLEPLNTDEVSRVWNLFPAANYRTSVAYLATPVWIDPELPPIDAARVANDRFGTAPGGTGAPP